ncbi:MAG: arsenic resistance protein [Candidatus Roseilinea sp.]|uniref:arsenic resistance protein n=1 Tax=Candidatus Roseilinea sp. TaxID=2838777 RepID=UPI00404B1D54
MVVGTLWPEQAGNLQGLLWPVLALLLYSTFTQVPLAHLRQAVSEIRFIQAAVFGNFVLIPAILWGLMAFLPEDPAMRLGIVMVLVVPCTDWFITFAHLGGGDTKHAISFAPISLLLQIILLPAYLSLLLGETAAISLARQEVIVAFAGMIALPLLGAFITEKWVEREARRRALIHRLAWAPVPLLCGVVFIIAATQVKLIADSVASLGQLALVYIGFLVIAGVLARLVARLFRLPPAQGRVLAFSLGTRNSFVVLPLALALPAAFDMAVVAIVFQSLVELAGMSIYLWWVPKRLFPQPRDCAPMGASDYAARSAHPAEEQT